MRPTNPNYIPKYRINGRETGRNISQEQAKALRESLENAYKILNMEPAAFDKFEALVADARNAIEAVMTYNNIDRIAIPPVLGYTNPNVGSKNLVVELTKFLGEGELMSRNHYDSAIEYFSLFGSDHGYVLEAVVDAIDYYKKNNVPLSDWDGESDITRTLRAADTSVIRKIIAEQSEKILGSECEVTTFAEVWSRHGLRIITLLNFAGVAPGAKDFYLDQEAESSSYDFDAFIKLECGVLGVAALINHYKIVESDAATMMNALAEALKADAQANGYRSAKDFEPLFDSLGIYYRLRSQGHDDDEFFVVDDEE